mmetsp:Transcript_108218/g.191639  ORF Transcript_108218/g.191639 Transcript_108218/m.191639 type:complete len:133 (+) Transcript_108218:214-612(+)
MDTTLSLALLGPASSSASKAAACFAAALARRPVAVWEYCLPVSARSAGELQDRSMVDATAAAESGSEGRGVFELPVAGLGLTPLDISLRSCSIRGLGASMSLTRTVCKGMHPLCGDVVRGERERGELRLDAG